MNVEVRTPDGDTVGEGRMLDEVALALRKDDEIVLPFLTGCWVISKRHLVVRQVDGKADMTLIVNPR